MIYEFELNLVENMTLLKFPFKNVNYCHRNEEQNSNFVHIMKCKVPESFNSAITLLPHISRIPHVHKVNFPKNFTKWKEKC